MKTVVINNVQYNNVPSVEIPLAAEQGNAVFYETSADTVVSGDVLATKTCHSANGSVVGSMTDNGAVTGTISTKAGTYSIPAGYHNGSGTASIAAAEQNKIVSSNIKSGVTILGVSGSSKVLDTTDATASTSTILNGYTAFVNGTKLTGELVVPAISQDSTTKVLTVS